MSSFRCPGMSPPVRQSLRKPVLGAYRPNAAGRCAACGRHRRLCSASCRIVARRLRPRRKRIRLKPPVGPACDIDDLSPATRQLIIIAQALHGSDWKRPTARDVGVDTKRIWRWLHGQGRPTTSDILRLLDIAKWRIEGISRAYTDVLHQLPGRPATRDDFAVERGPPPSRPHLTLWQPGGPRSR